MPLQGQRKYLEFSCRSTNYNHLIIAISLSISHLTRYEEDWMVKDTGTYSVQGNNMKTFWTLILKNSFQDKNKKCKIIWGRVAAGIKICFRQNLEY